MANMVFRMRLMPEPQGEPRRMVSSIDWNHSLDASNNQFESIIAVGTIPRTRIFARFNDDGAARDKYWEMMFNIHHPASTRSKAIKWSPSDWRILAIGSDDGTCLTVEIVRWDGEQFKKCNRVELPTSQKLSSVCWNSSENRMLAVLDPLDGTRAKMVIIENPTEADCIKSVVQTGYKASVCAVFRPFSNHILTCSADVATIQLWAKNESNVWSKISTIKMNSSMTEMSFNHDGLLLAGIGNGTSLKIWDVSDNLAADQPKLNLKSRGIEQEDKIKRYRGATLSEHCTNLSSVFFCRNNMVLTGSSRGSMCLHGVPRTTPRRRLTTFKVHAFQWCDVQFMYPQGEITCVQALGNAPNWLACGGTDGIVTIWEVVPGLDRPVIERNPNIEIFRYVPRFESLNDSVNLEEDDAEAVSSIATDRNDDLELLLTVKAELGALSLKQKQVQKKLKEANDGLTAGLKVIENVAENLGSAKTQNDEINISITRITQLLSAL